MKYINLRDLAPKGFDDLTDVEIVDMCIGGVLDNTATIDLRCLRFSL